MTLKTLQLSEPFGKVAYRAAGAGDPLVLIHGVGMQSAAWEPQINTLSQTHHVVAVDMPGHGGSDGLPATASLADFVAWLHAVLHALGTGPVSLAGHSMGALVSGGYAVTYPEMVARLALLNGVFRRSEDARAAVIARAEQIQDGVIDLETPLARWFGDGSGDQAARSKVSDWLSSVDQAGYATAYSAFARGDATYADRFSAISCPLLALTGDGDQNSSPAMSVAMAEAAQNGKSLVIEGHRHMVNLTAPDQVNTALRDWLLTPSQTLLDQKDTSHEHV
jgi:pimeloyl-ACP methyl ester carboxylesterase